MLLEILYIQIKQLISNELYSINISDFSNGVYFIEINENDSLHKQKFLVY